MYRQSRSILHDLTHVESVSNITINGNLPELNTMGSQTVTEELRQGIETMKRTTFDSAGGILSGHRGDARRSRQDLLQR